METRPPEVIAKLVHALVPPASREHVLGDLNERYVSPRQYLSDALRTLPFVIASRLRRTTHPLGLLLAGAFLWWAVFWGNRQESAYAALIPTLITLITLALRDVYRGVTPKWSRAAAIDIAIAASGVLLSQALLLLAAPSLLLTRDTLLVGFPLGFVILFAVRLQSPTGFHQPPGFARSISMQELRVEITQFETTIRRAVRVEMVACIAVALIFLVAFPWSPSPSPSPPVAKVGSVLTGAAALFVWWFLHRYGRVRPIAETLGFGESIVAYRAELERRRRLSQSYGWWYVTPLMTGMGLMMIGPQLQRPNSLFGVSLTVLILVAVGVILVLVHRAGARKAEQRIEQLRVVSEKMEST
jgi:hypothetical protein